MHKKQSDKPDAKNGAVRLNKFLSDAGVCSRREADLYIREGKIKVDGETAREGMKVTCGQEVLFMGKQVSQKQERILLMVNKPKGIVCTTKGQKNNIVDFLGFAERIYPIGRLDVASEGLLLMTNDGELMDEILRAKNYHEKEYIVTVNKKIDEGFIKAMREGIRLPELNTTTRPCKVQKKTANSFSIILTQGLNRQIRRMCEACGYRVVRLKRIRIMNLKLGELKKGQHRRVTGDELDKLFSLIKKSKGAGHGSEKQDEKIN